jgi:hypothetical protein
MQRNHVYCVLSPLQRIALRQHTLHVRWRWLGEKAAGWFCEWLAGLGVRTPGPGFLLHVQETHLLELLLAAGQLHNYCTVLYAD